MKVRFSLLLALALVASSASAAEMTFSGTAKIKPTLFANFDFDSSLNDAPANLEAGWASGEHVRAELRLQWNAKGEKWSVMMIGEADVIMEKDTADRSFYTAALKAGTPNEGAQFGIERAEMTYAFSPMLQLAAGWNIRAMDIATGGMVFGDDHPFIELKGDLAKPVKYQLGYVMIQNRPLFSATGDGFGGAGTRSSWSLDDWRAYYLKVPISIDGGSALKVTLSPFVLKSDDEARFARTMYYGAELTGQIAMIKPYAELAFVTGDFDLERDGTGSAPVAKDISSMTAFLGVEVPVTKALSPYAAFRYTKGDDDLADDEAQGFVGVTDIGRFTGLLGMDGNILGEHLASGASPYASPLYSYSPDRAVGGNVYGGIGNGSSGNNPGQQLIAVGARGDLGDFVPNLSYKAQLFYIMYDQTENLTNTANPGSKVDDYVGTTVDVQLKYAFSKEFAIDYIGSVFLPGDGIKDQVNTPTSQNDTFAQAHTLTFAWTY
jgi:hypothetical protein